MFSVRSTFGGSPGDAGFMIAPDHLPLTVAQVGPTAAGLLVGDHVVAIDGASLQGLLPDGAMFLVMNHRPGTTVTIGIERNGEARTLKIPVAVGHQ